MSTGQAWLKAGIKDTGRKLQVKINEIVSIYTGTSPVNWINQISRSEKTGETIFDEFHNISFYKVRKKIYNYLINIRRLQISTEKNQYTFQENPGLYRYMIIPKKRQGLNIRRYLNCKVISDVENLFAALTRH